ncbi:hypothetical protein EV383_6240 [Pseudonocardia sediminis]|uniref:Uncharacterized protein n=1 Tax=Pseudonocardia sediminis TaxID=1397368 RepID=A0A4Q7U7I0_PSEST|nr:hypothetical protein [Pseudonocardia sediminis]RZT75499.1 hypothetical protein EV383_6240 [Pseudonocardia sediminis]
MTTTLTPQMTTRGGEALSSRSSGPCRGPGSPPDRRSEPGSRGNGRRRLPPRRGSSGSNVDELGVEEAVIEVGGHDRVNLVSTVVTDELAEQWALCRTPGPERCYWRGRAWEFSRIGIAMESSMYSTPELCAMLTTLVL